MTDQSASTLVRQRKAPQLCEPAGSCRWTRVLVLCLAWMAIHAVNSQAQELSNNLLRLKLGVTSRGIPIIEQATWQATGETVFLDLATKDGLDVWFPGEWSSAAQAARASWAITEGDIAKAEATCKLANNMLITWIVELPKQSQLFRLHVRLTNQGTKARTIASFPAWVASWDVGGQSEWVRCWQSLVYDRNEQPLSTANKIRLGSRLHSSDDENGGVNPYWIVGGPESRIYFGLQWSGGWSAELQSIGNGLRLVAGLPSEETQLLLRNGETVEGPALLVTPVKGSDETNDRAKWMKQRSLFGQLLYPGPPQTIPFVYNSWYAIRRKVDRQFLDAQIAVMRPYSFDAFVVDAGWFGTGRWNPDRAKFQPGEFERMLTSLKANGIKPGLWSAPQFVSAEANRTHLTIETPAVSTRFFAGNLVDMSTANFASFLSEHVRTLRNTYSLGYWKYDQPLFTEHSRAGEMKNVIGFQNALQGVRRENPNLIIENCLNGGRMINEFTLLSTQTTWLRDLGTGPPDPRDNIRVALNAMEFVFPRAALRCTVNIDRVDENDDEMLRLCCRSAMAGMWGISSDLSKISAGRQAIVLEEIQHYRWLNRLKSSYLYDLQPPADNADVAGVTFYSEKRLFAGILLYRWNRKGTFDHHVALPKVDPELTYWIVDLDTGTEVAASGSDLIKNGLIIPFSNGRMSALVILEPVV